MSENGAQNSLGIINRTNRVSGVLVLSRVSDQTFLVVESHIAGRDTVALVIDQYLHLAVQHDTDAAIGRSQIYTDDVAEILFRALRAEGLLVFLRVGVAEECERAD